jgi:hypothetical protein
MHHHSTLMPRSLIIIALALPVVLLRQFSNCLPKAIKRYKGYLPHQMLSPYRWIAMRALIPSPELHMRSLRKTTHDLSIWPMIFYKLSIRVIGFLPLLTHLGVLLLWLLLMLHWDGLLWLLQLQMHMHGGVVVLAIIECRGRACSFM